MSKVKVQLDTKVLSNGEITTIAIISIPEEEEIFAGTGADTLQAFADAADKMYTELQIERASNKKFMDVLQGQIEKKRG